MTPGGRVDRELSLSLVIFIFIHQTAQAPQKAVVESGWLIAASSYFRRVEGMAVL